MAFLGKHFQVDRLSSSTSLSQKMYPYFPCSSHHGIHELGCCCHLISPQSTWPTSQEVPNSDPCPFQIPCAFRDQHKNHHSKTYDHSFHEMGCYYHLSSSQSPLAACQEAPTSNSCQHWAFPSLDPNQIYCR